MRIRGRRPLLYALLALVVPLPAFALTGGDATAQSLSVSASLGGCGLAQTTIMCEIDASWNSIEGADYYTASVSAPDGSVTDFGNVGSGSASVYIPYAGDGSYSVQVTAWGQPPKPNAKPQVIAREVSSPTPNPGQNAAQNDPGKSNPGRDSAKPETGSATTASPVGANPGGDAAQPTDSVQPTDPTTPVDPTPPSDCQSTPPTTTAPAAPTGDSTRTSADGQTGQSAAPPTPEPDPPPVDPACP